MTFDRISPPERRLLERDAKRTDRGSDDGRDILFSVGTQPGPHGRWQDTPLGLEVHCSRCGETSPLDAATALRSAFPLFLVAPWRDHGVFAICPAGRHRAWLRIQRHDAGT